MSTPPHILFNDVSFGFDDEQIISRLSFEAPAGQHTILKGESGRGKSTLLKLLLGFYKPGKGVIKMDRNPIKFHAIRKIVAWLPQDLNLGSGSVQNVINKPFEFSVNKAAENNRSKLIDTFETLGLQQSILDKEFRDISTGQRQRVGLALCHLLDKPLLLLDEPTSALDTVSKQRAAKLLLNNGKTVISTSHDPFWVKHADKIIEL